MPSIDVYNQSREKVGSCELNGSIFDVEVREHLFHEVVTAQLAARRSGTAHTKERGEVHGANTKAWRQKGTGRARQGSKKAPHWVGGGTVFGPRTRSFAKKVNRRTRQAALKAALSRRQQEGRLVILEKLEMSEIKTKAVAELLTRFEAPKTLIVDVANDTLARSAKNLSDSHYLVIDGINVYDILRHDTLMMTREAINTIEERLAS